LADNSAIVVAIISLISSITATVLTVVLNKRHDQELEHLKNSLAIQKDQQTAIREYEYDARKRLYEQFEPLLFQLIEHSDNALFRIRKLANAAKDGNLREGDGWLSRPGYFRSSTIYRLLLPLVVFRLMQYKLTIFDLDLVPAYRTHYLLGKSLYFTFSDDFYLSTGLEYSPQIPRGHETEWENLLKTQPWIYKKQGIPTGVIDNLVECLIKKPDKSLQSFSEFQQTYMGYNITTDEYEDQNVCEPFKRAISLFEDFHPRTRPVLWRILLTQAQIYEAIKKTRHMPKTASDFKILETVPRKDRENYDWRNSREESSDFEVFQKPFDAVLNYLKTRDNLRGLLETNDTKEISTQGVYSNSIRFKNVRSKDMEDVGYVESIDDNFVHIRYGQHSIKLSKRVIEGYNGSEVYLKISSREVHRYDLNPLSGNHVT
jgi:hypothetical protein